MSERVVIAADHGGVELKARLVEYLQSEGVSVEDLGTKGTESVDYPDYAAKVAECVSTGKADLGVLVCGTGIGMSIAAGKFPGVRAAVVHNSYTARMAREHNNANVLCLGGRVIAPENAAQIVHEWLHSTFEGGRHARRVEKINALDLKER